MKIAKQRKNIVRKRNSERHLHASVEQMVEAMLGDFEAIKRQIRENVVKMFAVE